MEIISIRARALVWFSLPNILLNFIFSEWSFQEIIVNIINVIVKKLRWNWGYRLISQAKVIFEVIKYPSTNSINRISPYVLNNQPINFIAFASSFDPTVKKKLELASPSKIQQFFTFWCNIPPCQCKDLRSPEEHLFRRIISSSSNPKVSSILSKASISRVLSSISCLRLQFIEFYPQFLCPISQI